MISKILVLLIVIYLILVIRYIHRTSSQIEIIQLPEAGFYQEEWNKSIKSRNPIIFFLDNSENLITKLDDIKFSKSLIKCENLEGTVSLPGTLFKQLCTDNQKLDTVYVKKPSLQIESVFSPYVSLFSSKKIIGGNGHCFIFPKNVNTTIKTHNLFLYWWQTDGISQVILFPPTSKNKSILKKNKNTLWNNFDTFHGTTYLEVKLSPLQVLVIPPHWYYTTRIISTSVVYQITSLHF